MLIIVVAHMLVFSCGAQTTLRFYYAIENLSDGSVVRRGQSTSQGIPQNELILAANAGYRAWLFNAGSGQLGFREFRTPDSGQRFTIPPIPMGIPQTPDTDSDGLTDDAEFVVGTNPLRADSDGDGIKDGQAILLGLDPGAAARTGIIASTDTPGNAVDVTAQNDIAVIADSASGISVFEISSRSAARIITQIDTPGNATAVALSEDFIAIADGSAGLAIVDISSPSDAHIIHQIPLNGSAVAVAASSDVAVVGTSSGEVSLVDLPTGTVLSRREGFGNIQDVGIQSGVAHILAVNEFYALPLDSFADANPARISVPGSVGAGGRRLRLFLGGSRAFITHTSGYAVVGLEPPTQPRFIRDNPTGQFGWKHLVLTGSGLGIAAADPNSTDDGAHDIYVYDIGNDDVPGTFRTTLATPGIARAVCVHNGLAYVADSANGLQVINFAPYDTGTNSPSLNLRFNTNLTSEGIEEGKPFEVDAIATDDVLVRNVEFFIDGTRVFADGSFPFGYRFIAPNRAGRTAFTFQVRATDTGGNTTWSELVTINVLPDRTPPRITALQPPTNNVVVSLATVFAYFNEPINPASLTNSVTATSAGPDNILETDDDVLLDNISLGWRDSIRAAVLTFPTSLGDGLYRISFNSNVVDLAGNSVAAPSDFPLWVLSDGPEGDADADGLTNREEAALGINPLNPDSDGDSWTDGAEVDEGTDPLDPLSRPAATFVALPMVEIAFPQKNASFGFNSVVARPQLEINVPARGEPSSIGTVIAKPTIEILNPQAGMAAGLGGIVAKPPVDLLLPGTETALERGTILAKPPVSVTIPKAP